MGGRQRSLEGLALAMERLDQMGLEAQRNAVAADLPYDLIQTLRLMHAIAESGFMLRIRPEDEKKLRQLHKVFGLSYQADTTGIPHLPGLYVDHFTPRTKVGTITRPLVMPHAILDHCRARWPEDRPLDVSFAGLLTESRQLAINTWLRASGLEEVQLEAQGTTLFHKAARRIGRMVGINPSRTVSTRNVTIVTSDQGRRFPVKSWNPDYYDLLLRSKFVLCPSGDFKSRGIAWTYRFFETVMAGAMPIIEEPCDIYAGFEYHLMSEPLGALRWQKDRALHNFERAREVLTVPKEELRAEVQRLRALAASPVVEPVRDYDNGIYAT